MLGVILIHSRYFTSNIQDENNSGTIWSDYETEEYAFWKENVTNKIWWVERKKEPVRSPLESTFDFKKIYNASSDYPDKLTKE